MYKITIQSNGNSHTFKLDMDRTRLYLSNTLYAANPLTRKEARRVARLALLDLSFKPILVWNSSTFTRTEVEII